MSNRSSPKISIIVPVYNVASFVEESLNSIRAQTFDDIEIIVVNDASTDGSGDICVKISQTDKRIVLIDHQENFGLSAARNTALDIARGDYIGFVDSDDIAEPEMYETLYHAAVDVAADIVVGGYSNIDEKGKIGSSFPLGDHRMLLTGTDKILFNISSANNCVWNKLYKKEVLRFPVGKTFEDIYIMHTLFDRAERVYLIPNVIYQYRIRQTGITLRPFVASNMDIVEAYIQRYQYILEKYPENDQLVRFAGKSLFNNFLYCVGRAVKENKLKTYEKEIKQMIDSVRQIDWRNFHLNCKTENALALIMQDVRLYAFAWKSQSGVKNK